MHLVEQTSQSRHKDLPLREYAQQMSCYSGHYFLRCVWPVADARGKVGHQNQLVFSCEHECAQEISWQLGYYFYRYVCHGLTVRNHYITTLV